MAKMGEALMHITTVHGNEYVGDVMVRGGENGLYHTLPLDGEAQLAHHHDTPDELKLCSQLYVANQRTDAANAKVRSVLEGTEAYRQQIDELQTNLKAAEQALVASNNTWVEPPSLGGLAAVQRAISTLSHWVDNSPANAKRDPEALTWHRVAKVSEEAGEAIDEMIKWVGGNPRKPKSLSSGALVGELLDAAVSALGAVEHLFGNPLQGCSLELLEAHMKGLIERSSARRVEPGGSYEVDLAAGEIAVGEFTGGTMTANIQVNDDHEQC